MRRRNGILGSYDNVRGLEWENQAGREEGEGSERGNMGREQN